MGLIKTLGILLSVTLAIFLGYVYQQASQPFKPMDVNLIKADGGRWITLRDGRIFEYFVSGLENMKANNKVIVAIHGYTMTGKSMVELFELENRGASTGITLIAPTMPGNGGSTPHLNRTLESFAHDVKELVDHLGVSNFCVAGYSFGGPHASAVAYYMNDRVDNVALLYPVSETLHAHQARARMAQILIADAPVLGPVLQFLIHKMVHNDTAATAKLLARMVTVDFEEMAGPNQMIFVRDFVRSALHYSEGLRTRTALADGSRGPWAFKVEQIALGKKDRKVYLYGGEIDSLVPYKSLDHLKDNIPGVIFTGGKHAHFYIFKKPEVYITALTKLFEK